MKRACNFGKATKLVHIHQNLVICVFKIPPYYLLSSSCACLPVSEGQREEL